MSDQGDLTYLNLIHLAADGTDPADLTRGEIEGNYFDGRWKPVIGINYSTITRHDLDYASVQNPFPFNTDSWFNGRRLQADFKNLVKVIDQIEVIGGIDYDRQWAYTNTVGPFTPYTQAWGTMAQTGIYGQLRLNPFEGFNLNVGGRVDMIMSNSFEAVRYVQENLPFLCIGSIFPLSRLAVDHGIQPAVYVGGHIGTVMMPAVVRADPVERPGLMVRALTFTALVLFPMSVGASTVLLEKASPPQLLDGIKEFHATVLFTAPTSYRTLAARGIELKRTHLRKCVSAGEALPASTRALWKEATGIELIDGIGATEMLHIFISHTEDKARPGATGKPVPGYQAKVVDDDGNEVPRGTVGKLAVAGPTGCRSLDDERQRHPRRNGRAGQWQAHPEEHAPGPCPQRPRHLDASALDTPSLALANAARETLRVEAPDAEPYRALAALYAPPAADAPVDADG